MTQPDDSAGRDRVQEDEVKRGDRSRGRRRARPTCFSCGGPADTRDHIPPKGVFPDPRPKTLITVPACAACNAASKLDDEYFRWLVATVGDQTAESDQLIRERILPRFNDRPALLRSIMKASRIVDVVSPSGLWLGRRPAFEFDRPRVQAVVEKIVRGLHFHEHGATLARPRVSEFVLNPELADDQKATIASLRLRDAAPNVFGYRVATEGPDGQAYWFLMFFNKALFVVAVVPAALSPSPVSRQPLAGPTGA